MEEAEESGVLVTLLPLLALFIGLLLDVAGWLVLDEAIAARRNGALITVSTLLAKK